MDAIKEQFNCANDKALKIINELDIKSGIGLIEKKRQGLGKPNRIYVKDFMVFSLIQIIEIQISEKQKSRFPIIGIQELRITDFKISENRKVTITILVIMS